MDKRPITANELRKLAEAADGIRDEPAFLVWRDGIPKITRRVESSDELIMECRTPASAPRRPSFKSIHLDPPMVDQAQVPVPDIATRFDAMFWSDSAFEKFAVPYYARISTQNELERIRAAFYSSTTFAMIHPPLSNATFLSSARTGGNGLEALTLRDLEARL